VRRWIERYLVFGETSRLADTEFWRVLSQDEDARLVDEARENTFLNSVQLKRNTAFPGCPRTVNNRLTEAVTSGSAALKEKLSEERRLFQLALPEDNVDRDWGNVIFSDESVFSSENSGPVTMQNT
jgi:hypothetical protein